MTVSNVTATTIGKTFNFFQKVNVSVLLIATNPDFVITFPTQTVTFQLESGSGVSYSFDGNNTSGDMTSGKASATLTFDNRVISKVWFWGTGVVRVEAWGTR
jgi:hypothetical protein